MFIVYTRTDDIYVEISKDIQIRFDTSNYRLDSLFPKGKNRKVIGLIKDELGQKIMTEFDILSPKHATIQQMIMMKIKKQKTQKVCHKTKNWNIINLV